MSCRTVRPARHPAGGAAMIIVLLLLLKLLAPASTAAAAPTVQPSSFADCRSCLAAGFGWSQKRNRCGNFATKDASQCPHLPTNTAAPAPETAGVRDSCASGEALSSRSGELQTLRRQHAALAAEVKKLRQERAALEELVTDPLATGRGVRNISEFEVHVIGSPDIAVRTSSIGGAGRGGFANRRFLAKEELGEYRCLPTATGAGAGRADPDPTRSWGLNSTHVCDGSHYPLNNPLLYVNSVASNETCALQNVVIQVRPPPRTRQAAAGEGVPAVVYVATRSIEVGEVSATSLRSMAVSPQLTQEVLAAGRAG
jgi:hypothetical protein